MYFVYTFFCFEDSISVIIHCIRVVLANNPFVYSDLRRTAVCRLFEEKQNSKKYSSRVYAVVLCSFKRERLVGSMTHTYVKFVNTCAAMTGAIACDVNYVKLQADGNESRMRSSLLAYADLALWNQHRN